MPSDCSEDEEECSGEINVFVEDSSGNQLEGVYAYLNGGGAYSTDSDGFRKFEINNEICDDAHSVQIKCSDQSTVCGSDSTRISYNGDVDSLNFICDICSGDKDVLIDIEDVTFADVSGDTNLSLPVKSIGLTGNVDVMMSCGNQMFNESVSLVSGGNVIVNFVEDLSGCDKVDIWFAKVSGESDVDNNRIDGLFVIDVVKVKLNIDTGYSLVDVKIEDFIGDYAQVVTDDSEDLEIFIGRGFAPDYNGEWGLESKLIRYNDKKEGLPYNGLLVKEGSDIYVFGNELDGTIASVRQLIEERGKYLNERELSSDGETYLGEEDIDAISVFDYLHTDENDEFYRKNNAEFADIVDSVLRKKTFNIAIKRVLTANDNTSLRMKNINYEMSPEFREFTDERPVVLGHGLFENLFSMEKLGYWIAVDDRADTDYRDTWLIEMTGGPNTECDNCPNYNMSDLTNYYWPALIGGVLAYTGESEIDYVGYDLGGGVGIRSYEKYRDGEDDMGYYLNGNESWESFDLPANFTDHMILVAPIGSFNGDTIFVRCIGDYGNRILSNNLLEEFSHVSSRDIGIRLFFDSLNLKVVPDLGMPGFKIEPEIDSECVLFAAPAISLLAGNSNISSNLWRDIVEDVQNETNPNPSLTNIDELLIIRSDNSSVIPYEDLQYIYENSNANEKYRARVDWWHKDLHNTQVTYKLISKFLNDKSFGVWDYMYHIDIT